jgi:hypothetical protein
MKIQKFHRFLYLLVMMIVWAVETAIHKFVVGMQPRHPPLKSVKIMCKPHAVAVDL